MDAWDAYGGGRDEPSEPTTRAKESEREEVSEREERERERAESRWSERRFALCRSKRKRETRMPVMLSADRMSVSEGEVCGSGEDPGKGGRSRKEEEEEGRTGGGRE